MHEKFACFFVPVYVPKQAGKINSFGTVFCLKLGQSNLSEYLEIERKFVSVWDKKITAVGTKSACDFAESMGQNGREK